MYEIIQINKGVWFFKNQKWKKAQNIWERVDAKIKKGNSASISEVAKQVFFPISLAFNQALISCLFKEFDKCLESINKIMMLLTTLDK